MLPCISPGGLATHAPVEQRLNTLKTLFLLATLTSMLVLMGALVGERIGYAMPGHMMGMRMVGASIGMGGMFLVAMIVNFGTWFFAHKIVIMSTGARPLRDNELVWLHQATEELAEAAKPSETMENDIMSGSSTHAYCQEKRD